MNLPSFKNLCSPAYVYLVISMILIILIFFQNFGNSQTYCVGSHSCDVSSTYLIFAVKLVYVMFWTWILNLICKSGATSIAWFLVLLPFIIAFILMAMVLM